MYIHTYMHTHIHTLLIQLLLMALVFVLMWVLISIGLGGIMVYHVQTMLTCRERRAEVKAGNADRVVTCLSYVDTSEY